jgi:hypothetical protein
MDSLFLPLVLVSCERFRNSQGSAQKGEGGSYNKLRIVEEAHDCAMLCCTLLTIGFGGLGFFLGRFRHLRLRQPCYRFIKTERVERHWRTLFACWIRVVFLTTHGFSLTFYVQSTGLLIVPPAPSGIASGNCDFGSNARGRSRWTEAATRSSTAAPRIGLRNGT